MSPGRFQVVLSVAGRPMMRGWWASEATARDKLREWIGERGSMPGARVTLVDEETGDVLTTWPDET